MYYFMYYITFKVALSGIGIIRVFNLIYYIIIVFYAWTFWSPADLFTRWGIDLFSPPDPFYRYFRSGDRFISPPDLFRGDGIPRNTGRSEVISARNAPLEKACRFEKAKEEESGRCIKEMQRIVEWTEGAFQREGPLKATDGDCAIAVLLRGIKNSKAY